MYRSSSARHGTSLCLFIDIISNMIILNVVRTYIDLIIDVIFGLR